MQRFMITTVVFLGIFFACLDNVDFEAGNILVNKSSNHLSSIDQ